MKNERSSPAKPLGRIFGYDLARTFSLFGMVIISFWELAGEENNAPGWLNIFVEIIMGRAAVAFVILAGVGLHLLTQAACSSADPVQLIKGRRQLMKRALFLFIIGILNSLIWPWDILHFYAVYFMIASFLLCAPNRLFWALIYLAILTFSIFMFITEFDRGTDWDSILPTDLIYLSGVFYHLLFGGLYPVFPWIGFLFIGIWLGRRDLTHRDFRRKTILFSGIAVVVSEAAAWLFFRVYTSEWRLGWVDSLVPWLEIDAWEPMPLFFISGTGSAIIMICLCIILAEKAASAKWLPPLVAVGQSTLTLYVAHTLIGTTAILLMDLFEVNYSLFAVWGTVSYFISATLFCYFWNRRFKRGPLELLMRRFLAQPIRLTFSGVHPLEIKKE
jgi:uncharacterized membrane protein YeiB